MQLKSELRRKQKWGLVNVRVQKRRSNLRKRSAGENIDKMKLREKDKNENVKRWKIEERLLSGDMMSVLLHTAMVSKNG